MKILSIFCFALGALLLGGCSQTLFTVNNPNDPIWQADTTREVARDLREDGKIDFVWPEWVPEATREKIIKDAETLNKNHTGQ